MGNPANPILGRLERLSIPEPNSGCWLWLGAVNEKGYGRISIGSRRGGTARMLSAHRVAYSAYSREAIPDGLNVCHQCDNPSCINPGHLFLGTQAENVSDMYGKGRARPSSGEAHHNAKITQAIANEIRRLRATGLTRRKIEIALGLSRGVVENVVAGKTWK